MEAGHIGVDDELWARALKHDGPVIVTVHGTGDGSPLDDGEPREGGRWWQTDSAFTRKIQAEVGDRNLFWLPFHWSGDNSELRREAAVEPLAELCGALSDHKVQYFVLAHSHGGNLIDRAIMRHRYRMGFSDDCRGIVSIGTPFFIRSALPKLDRLLVYLPSAALFVFGGLGLLAALPVTAVAAALGAVLPKAISAMTITTLASAVHGVLPADTLSRAVDTAACLLAMTVFYLIAFRRRMPRDLMALNVLSSRWLPIMSQRDEVIALLSIFTEKDRLLNFTDPDMTEEAAFVQRAKSLNEYQLTYGKYLRIALPAAFGLVYLLFGDIMIHPERILDMLHQKPAHVSQSGDMVMSVILLGLMGILASYASMMVAFALARLRLVNRLSRVAVAGNSKAMAYGDTNLYALKTVDVQPQHLMTRAPVELAHDDIEGTDLSQARAMIYKDVIELRSVQRLLRHPQELFASLMGGIYHNAYFTDKTTIELTAKAIREAFS